MVAVKENSSDPFSTHLSGRNTVKRTAKQVFPALYDLSADISEDDNVAAENADVVERLTALLKEHKEEVKANGWPVGKVEK